MTNHKTRETVSSRLFVRAAIGCLIAISAIAFTPPPPASMFAVSVDFTQSQNDKTTLGDIQWVNGILGQHAYYTEGMGVPQRVILQGITPTSGNVHRLHFSHQVLKAGGVHAYDFLMSWEQAFQTGIGKGPAPSFDNPLEELLTSGCEDVPGSLGTTACNNIYSSGSVATADLPDMDGFPDPGPGCYTAGNSVQDQIDGFETYMNGLGLPRVMKVRVPSGATINPVATVVFEGYFSASGEVEARYYIEWVSSSPTAIIEYAAHIAAGASDGIVPGYGIGCGAAQIPGASYHTAIINLTDGSDLNPEGGGSQDNQLQGSSVFVPPPNCEIHGPTTACQNETGLAFNNGVPLDPTVTYLWSFTSNTSPTPAQIVSGQGTNAITVNAGSPGTFTLELSKTNAGGTTTCSQVVTVNANTTATDPPDQTVCSGTDVTFQTTASGAGTLTYAWTFEGAPIGGNSPSLPLGPVDESDEGTYCVTVTGTCGQVQQCAELVVNDNTATTDPPDQTVCAGANVTFTTVASGTGPFTYAWTFEGAPIGGNSPSLPLGVVDVNDAGTYCVTVTGVCGQVQQCAELVVNAITTTTDPPDQTVCAGTNVTFQTSASGTGPFTYAWTFEGAPVGGNSPSLPLGIVDESDEGTYCVTVTGACGPPVQQCAELVITDTTTTTDPPDQEVCTGESVSFTTVPSGTGPFTFAWTFEGAPIGGNTATLNLGAVDESDEGTYCVTVTGSCGPSPPQCAELVVNALTTATDPPDQTVCSGADVTFTTSAGGTGPFTYAWTFEGNPIGGNSPSLPLGPVDSSDEGTYCVTVTGECGPPVERCAELVVNDLTSTTDPPDQTVCAGADVTFTTVASGTGPFTYAWTFDGDPIGGNSPSLPLGAVDASDEGEYCVTVTGACGPPVEECANLTVNTAVTTTDPEDQVACEGEEVCFSTSPSGTGPFTFVWTKDGDPTVLGTTAELCISDVEAEDAGTYCVTVTGACGGPVEQCARLDINRPPRVQALADKEVCPGEPVEWTAIVTGTGPFTFKWYKADDPATVLDTDDTFEIPSRTLEDAGDYCVDVTGTCGDPVTQCATLTVMVCDEVFCTFTQGFWGNSGGKFNGQTKEQLLTQPPFNLMGTDLTVGVDGVRSLTIPSSSWECIILRLPAGGTPTTLPDFGDQTMGPDPGCDVPNLPLKNGKFKNVFLGQVIALSLNVRFDPELVDLELCNLMTTLEIDPGPDGLVHTDDDVPIPGTEKVVFISPVIMDALDNLGLDQTVGGLLELANLALAGEPTGGASISAINGAVDAINNGFDECRLMTSCEEL